MILAVLSALAGIMHLASPARAQVPEIQLAKQLVREKQWKPAAQRLMGVLSKHPRDQEGRLLLAEVFLETGAHAESHGLLDELIEEGYKEDHALLLRGRVRVAILDYEGALADFTRAAAVNSDLDRMTMGFDLALALRHTGQCKEALSLMDTLFETDSSRYKANPAYYRLLAGCRMALGEFAEARMAARLGLDVGVFDPWLIDDMGWAEMAQGRESAAINTFMSLLSGELSKMKDHAPVRLSLPFDGPMRVLRGQGEAPWHQSMRNYFFWDLRVLGKFNREYKSSGRKVKDYYCFGQPVLSPVDGWVVGVENNRPDNRMDMPDWTHPLGNHVRIWVQGGPTVTLAHMRKDSIKVKKAAQVTRGQEIGQCGNSGSAGTPHLEIGARAGPSESDRSVPVVFDGFITRVEARIEKHSNAVPETGALMEPCAECVTDPAAAPKQDKAAGKPDPKTPAKASSPAARAQPPAPTAPTPGYRRPSGLDQLQGKKFQWGSDVDKVGDRIRQTEPVNRQ